MKISKEKNGEGKGPAASQHIHQLRMKHFLGGKTNPLRSPPPSLLQERKRHIQTKKGEVLSRQSDFFMKEHLPIYLKFPLLFLMSS